MTNRSRFLVPMLALAVALPATPVLAQTDADSRGWGDVVADGIEDLARRVGSAQDAI